MGIGSRWPASRGRTLILAGFLLALVALFIILFAVRPPRAERTEFREQTVRVIGPASVTIDPVEAEPPVEPDLAPESVRVTEPPDAGEVLVNADGSLTYSPPADFIGTDEFTYRHEPASTEREVVTSVTVVVEEQPVPTASQEELDFGELCVWCAETSDPDISIETSPGAAVVDDLRLAGADRDQFVVEDDCAGLGGGDDSRDACRVQVTYQPTRPGASRARIEVRADGGHALTIELAGEGTCERPDEDHLALLEEAVGFGAGATGGAAGCLVRVTSLDDEGDGSLREAATLPGPAWIVFDESGTIDLDDHIVVAADKTIDARGAEVDIRGAGLYMVDTPNIIVSDVDIQDSYEDGLQIRGEGTRDIWVHHVAIGNVADGYIDITQGATDVTISWSRFEHSPDYPQEKVILVGAADPGDPDELSRVTIHHNLIDGTEQRNPLLRAGTVHTFNNYFHYWGIYGSGVGDGGKLLSERNVYEYAQGTHPDRAFTPWGSGPAYIRSSDDLFLEDTSGEEADPEEVPDPDYEYEAEPADDDLIDAIVDRAGPRE